MRYKNIPVGLLVWPEVRTTGIVIAAAPVKVVGNFMGVVSVIDKNGLHRKLSRRDFKFKTSKRELEEVLTARESGVLRTRKWRAKKAKETV